jgi:hypothetical protein
VSINTRQPPGFTCVPALLLGLIVSWPAKGDTVQRDEAG